MDFFTQFEESQARTDENFKVTAVVSLHRANHRFGPKTFGHGTLFFVRDGRIHLEIHETKLQATIRHGHFIWLPPGLTRSTSTDEQGADMHALLLERVIDRGHLLPYLRPPDAPVISVAEHPEHVATLFKSAERQRADAGQGQNILAAHGYAHLILSAWSSSLALSGASPHMEAIIKSVIGHIVANFHRPDLDVHELCAITPWSRRYFFKAFQLVTGMTPQRYIQQTRLNRAMDLLSIGELKVSDVARRCGFLDAAYFSRLFARHVGRPPSAFNEANPIQRPGDIDRHRA